MKAEIIKLTPEVAKELLRGNINNRPLKASYRHYVRQMKDGLWKENGEPIIIDKDGFMKDGQHRCHAVIEADFSFMVPLITGVEPDVMDTIDTGTNRSLSDVLHLNGFKSTSQMASLIKGIFKYNAMLTPFDDSTSKRAAGMTNSQGLKYATENAEAMEKLNKAAMAIYQASASKVLTVKEIGVALYAIGGHDFRSIHMTFMRGICGKYTHSGSSTAWLFTKLLSFTNNKVSTTSMWKYNSIIRAWNVFCTGDPSVKYLRVSTDKLEDPLEIAPEIEEELTQNVTA